MGKEMGGIQGGKGEERSVDGTWIGLLPMPLLGVVSLAATAR